MFYKKKMPGKRGALTGRSGRVERPLRNVRRFLSAHVNCADLFHDDVIQVKSCDYAHCPYAEGVISRVSLTRPTFSWWLSEIYSLVSFHHLQGFDRQERGSGTPLRMVPSFYASFSPAPGCPRAPGMWSAHPCGHESCYDAHDFGGRLAQALPTRQALRF